MRKPEKRLRLLAFHKLLVAFSIGLGVVMIVWGSVHGLQRGERQGYAVLGLGLFMAPLGALYLRKLYRNPPIR